MDYFKLKHSLAKKEIGSQYPQIQKMTKGYDYDGLNSVHRLSRYVNRFPDFEPNLNSFVLHKGAKMTDLLSSAVTTDVGLLISERLMNIILTFNIVPTHSFKAAVTFKEQEISYYWLHIISNFNDKVDYSKSSFFISDFETNLGDIKISSLSSLLGEEKLIREKYKKPFATIKNSHTVLDHSLSKYAFFSIGGFDFDYYIRQDLKNEINKNLITGLDLNEKANFSFRDL